MTPAKTLSAQEHAASFSKQQRTIALTIVAIAFVMDLLDSTIVNIAIPTIRTNLPASFSAIQWIVAGYSLAFSLLLVTGGRMGDVFGYKKLFLWGIGGFTVASLLSGLAPNATVLICARILQGSMAALMVPQVMSLMQIMYKPEERGAINGLFGTLGGLAASLGPLIGGLLIKANILQLDWRPIFLINIPIGLFGIIAAIKYLPNGKSSHPLKFDTIGTILVMVALLLLVYPLIEGRDLGWPLWTFAMMIASLPMLGVFWWWQRKKDKLDGSPLILPSLFKHRSFGIGLGVNALFYMAIIGYFLTFGLTLQIGLNFSPIHAALTGLPVAIGIAAIMGILGEKVIPKLGRHSLNIGIAIIITGLLITVWVFTHYGVNVHSWQFIPSLLLTGCGMGFVFGTLVASVLSGVDARHAGSASGTMNAIQQLGSAVGVALIGVVFFGSLNHAAASSFQSVAPTMQSTLQQANIPFNEQAVSITDMRQCYIDRSTEKDPSITPPSCAVANQSPIAHNPLISQLIYRQIARANDINFYTAFRGSMIFSIAILVIAFFATFALPARFYKRTSS